MIYLDNAATSLPKPPQVAHCMAWAVEHLASPGRGSAEASQRAEELLYRLRTKASEMFDCEPEHVVLTGSATHGLNIAIKSLVKPGDRVVVSCMEHNAVVRPLYALGAKVETAGEALFEREGFLCALDRLLTKHTAACILTHVSNVFGWILPVEQAAKMCRERNIPFVLDASQSAGVLPLSLRELGAAFIAMPGHKGLLGPQGTGLLLCGGETKTLLEGGTGSLSLQRQMPEFLPDRLEPGTHNMPGAAGLLAGMAYVEKQGTQRLLAHETMLRRRLARQLSSLEGIRVFEGEDQTGVLSFTTENHDCVMLAELLAKKGFALRAGLHCAPLAHETAGTLDTGTLRVSPGAFSSTGDVDALAANVRRLLKKSM